MNLRYSESLGGFTSCLLWKTCQQMDDCSTTCQYALTGKKHRIIAIQTLPCMWRIYRGNILEEGNIFYCLFVSPPPPFPATISPSPLSLSLSSLCFVGRTCYVLVGRRGEVDNLVSWTQIQNWILHEMTGLNKNFSIELLLFLLECLDNYTV